MHLPSLEDAETLLADAEGRNPGPWIAHSGHVALAARHLAERHPDLDAKAAYVLGLLHDIGRREGVTGMRHALDGYTYLTGLGHSAAARICLTHSFSLQNIDAIFGHWDVSEDEYAFARAYVEGLEYDDYDRLIQLCDCLALPQGLCLLEKRMIDVALHYGVDELTVPKWRAYIDLQKHFEGIIGTSIYEVLPGVVETTFGPAH